MKITRNVLKMMMMMRRRRMMMMRKQPFPRVPLTPEPPATVSVKMPQRGWPTSNRNCWRSEIGVPAWSGSVGESGGR